MGIEKVLRRAAEIVEASWSSENGPLDANGERVRLYGGTIGDTARAGPNPAIASHTLYSAIVWAAHELPQDAAGGLAAAWVRLSEVISGQTGAAVRGGVNHLHPVHGFNVAEGRTAADVAALLNQVADSFDPPKQPAQIEGPSPTAARLPPPTL